MQHTADTHLLKGQCLPMKNAMWFFFHGILKHSRKWGPKPSLHTTNKCPPPAPRRHAWALSAPFFPGRAAPALSKARPFGHRWHTVRPFLKVWHVVTTPSNPLRNAKDLCRLVPDPSSAGKKTNNKKNLSEIWEGRSAWAAPARLKGLLPRSVDHTSVRWHPLTAFSITMALSHLCPSSLSQLNELFPRQIKTGETAFSRGRRLGIRMGASGHSWEPGLPMGNKGTGEPTTRNRDAGSMRQRETTFTLCPGVCGSRGKPLAAQCIATPGDKRTAKEGRKLTRGGPSHHPRTTSGATKSASARFLLSSLAVSSV